MYIKKIKEYFCSYKYILKLIKISIKYKKIYFFILLIITILYALLPFISLIDTQILMNSIQTSKSLNPIIIFSLIILIIVGFFYDFLGAIKSYLSNVYSEYLSLEFNVLLLNQSRYLKLSDYESNEIYNLIQRAEAEAGNRAFKVMSTFLALISSLIKIISSIFIIVKWNLFVIPVIMIIPILSSIFFIKLGKKEYLMHFNRSKDLRKTWYLARLLTKDTSYKEVKLFNLYDYIISQFKNLRLTFFNQDIELSKIKRNLSLVFQVLTTVIINIFVLEAVFDTIDKIILLGTMSTIISTLSNFDGHIKSIIGSLYSLYEDSLYASNLINYIELTNKYRLNFDLNRKKEYIETIDTIEFKNVYYKYENSKEYALKNINLKIESGNKIFLSGKNGSGKSTFLKLILGFYENYEGEILINGINLKNINMVEYQKKVSVVFQDFSKFQMTVKENIILGDISQQDDIKLKEVLEKLDYSFINHLPNNLYQQVGTWFKDGVELSGGQWQKLAIARANFRKGDLYIFDEATSALDQIAKAEFFEESRKLKAICIYVSHDNNIMKNEDKIIELEKGTIKNYCFFKELRRGVN